MNPSHLLLLCALCLASCVGEESVASNQPIPIASKQTTKKPVLYYSFDKQRDNSIKDKSGHGNNGSAHGAMWSSQGILNGSLAFDGIASHVDVDLKKRWSDLMDGQHPVSFSIWFNRQAFQGDALFVNGFDPYACLCHFSNPDHGRLYFYFKHGSDVASIRVYADGFTETNQWQHVGITYDGSGNASGVAIYKNGVAQVVQIVENGLDGAIQTDEPLTIGAYRGGGQTLDWLFKGYIDEFKIFNRQLTPEEVTDLSLAPISPTNLLRL